MTEITHLASEVRPYIGRPADERIAFARRDLWIESGAAKEALSALEDLLWHPRVQRMPCMLLAADSGNGKSTVISKFRADHAVVAREGGIATMPVIVMDMPDKPLEWRFWSDLLRAMMVAHRQQAPTNKSQALSVLERLQCRMLVIDEVHNILQGQVAQQRHMLALLKNLSNALMLPIVAAGTRDAIRTLHTDSQLSDRFDVLALPRWKLDKEYLKLLASFEALMPLAQPSGLSKSELAVKIFDMSGKTIGTTAKIVRNATAAAIRSGKERITPDLLDEIANVPLRGYKGEDL